MAFPAGPERRSFSTLPCSRARVIRWVIRTDGSTVEESTVEPSGEFTIGTGVELGGVLPGFCEAATGPLIAAVGVVIGKVTWTERIRPSSTKKATMLIVTASVSVTSIAVTET